MTNVVEQLLINIFLFINGIAIAHLLLPFSLCLFWVISTDLSLSSLILSPTVFLGLWVGLSQSPCPTLRCRCELCIYAFLPSLGSKPPLLHLICSRFSPVPQDQEGLLPIIQQQEWGDQSLAETAFAAVSSVPHHEERLPRTLVSILWGPQRRISLVSIMSRVFVFSSKPTVNFCNSLQISDKFQVDSFYQCPPASNPGKQELTPFLSFLRFQVNWLPSDLRFLTCSREAVNVQIFYNDFIVVSTGVILFPSI